MLCLRTAQSHAHIHLSLIFACRSTSPYADRSSVSEKFCVTLTCDQGWNCRGVKGFDPQLSFQPPYSLLFFNYHDFSRALLTLPVIFLGIPTLPVSRARRVTSRDRDTCLPRGWRAD